LAAKVCGVPHPEESTVKRRGTLHSRTFADATARKTVLERFGHSPSDVTVRLNRANVDCEHCARALLRGAFLSCGAVTNPERDYHLEFSVPHYNLSRDLLALLGEEGFPAKMVSRNGSYIVYIKESERIEDCLTYLGASRGALEMMSVKMVKSIRNETNRRLNCENANIDKTIAAAGAHADAIRRIRAAGALDSLTPELQQLALLREENPDMSLRELGAALDPPLSRSGVNHRLQRLLTIADELTGKERNL
jgi:DNA-binding protein WhiA